MITNKLALLIFLLVFVFSSCNKAELNGDIFIVTQGAQNYKMGLVEVTAIPEDVIQPYLNSKKSNDRDTAFKDASKKSDEANAILRKLEDKYKSPKGMTYKEMERASNELSDARRKAEEANKFANETLTKAFSSSPDDYFEDLPKGVASATTDADGKFALKLPKTGKYANAARAQRNVFNKTEFYYWLLWANVNGNEPQKIILSNNNLTNAKSPDSVIQTNEY